MESVGRGLTDRLHIRDFDPQQSARAEPSLDQSHRLQRTVQMLHHVKECHGREGARINRCLLPTARGHRNVQTLSSESRIAGVGLDAACWES